MITTFQPPDVLLRVDLANPLNRSHRLADGLQLWWMGLPGLDGGNKIYDLCGLSRGTLTTMGNANNGWRGTTRPGGYSDILFDGTAGYVICASCPVPTIPISIVCWFNNTANGAAIVDIASVAASSASTSNRVRLTYNPVGGYRFLYTDGGGTQHITSTISGNLANTWYQATAVIGTTSGTTTYINNTSANLSTTNTVNNTNFAQVTLGVTNQLNGFWTGRLDSLMIYNRELTAAEVVQLYNIARVGYPGLLNRVGYDWMAGIPPLIGAAGSIAQAGQGIIPGAGLLANGPYLR